MQPLFSRYRCEAALSPRGGGWQNLVNRLPLSLSFPPSLLGGLGWNLVFVSVSPMVGDLKVVSGLEWILCSSERVAEIFVSGTFRLRGALELSNSRACVTYAVICSNLCFV